MKVCKRYDKAVRAGIFAAGEMVSDEEFAAAREFLAGNGSEKWEAIKAKRLLVTAFPEPSEELTEEEANYRNAKMYERMAEIEQMRRELRAEFLAR